LLKEKIRIRYLVLHEHTIANGGGGGGRPGRVGGIGRPPSVPYGSHDVIGNGLIGGGAGGAGANCG
jgi:hypothetical protein